jgi:hypothetical protein
MMRRAPVRSINRPIRGEKIAPTPNMTVIPANTISLGRPSDSPMCRPSTDGIR